MKVIDLLNKIANDEEVPQRIKCEDKEFEYVGGAYEDINGNDLFYYDFSCSAFLNKETEILDEIEKKIPEKIDMFDYFTGYDFSGTDLLLLQHLETNFETINKTINEIVDYLKSKGE